MAKRFWWVVLVLPALLVLAHFIGREADSRWAERATGISLHGHLTAISVRLPGNCWVAHVHARVRPGHAEALIREARLVPLSSGDVANLLERERRMERRCRDRFASDSSGEWFMLRDAVAPLAARASRCRFIFMLERREGRVWIEIDLPDFAGDR